MDSRADRRSQATNFLPSDTLIRWRAPFPGHVLLSGAIRRHDPGGGPDDDGVLVRIYKNNATTPLWERTFLPGDVAPCEPTGGNGCNGGGLDLGTLTGSDRIFMQIHALADPVNDEIEWDPVFTYLGKTPDFEPYGAPRYTFSQANDFRLAGPAASPWTASARGAVTVTVDLTKPGTLSDNAVLVIERGNSQVAAVPIDADQVLPPGTTHRWVGSCSAPAGTPERALCVNEGDILFFRIRSDTQIDPQLISVQPRVEYNFLCRQHPERNEQVCGNVSCSDPASPPVLCSTDNDPLPNDPVPQEALVSLPEVFFRAPQYNERVETQSFVSTVDGRGHVRGPHQRRGFQVATVLVQGVGRLVAKAENVVIGPFSTPLQLSGTVRNGETLFLTVLSANGANWQPQLNGGRLGAAGELTHAGSALSAGAGRQPARQHVWRAASGRLRRHVGRLSRLVLRGVGRWA